MNLYAFQPKHHGPFSFFTMAESQVEAEQNIDAYIEGNLNQYEKEEYLSDYHIKGWKTGGYYVSVLKPGEVIAHDND